MKNTGREWTLLNGTNPYYSSAPVMNEESRLFTPPELAEYLGIGRNRAYELVKSGELKAFRIGKSWKISKEAVDLYIRQQSGLV